MKRIVYILVLLSFLIIFLSPLIAFAQVKECCYLKSAVKYKLTKSGVEYDVTYDKEKWIANDPKSANACEKGSPAINTKCSDLINPTAVPPDLEVEDNCYTEENEWATVCLLNVINRVFDWVFVFIFALVGVMIVVGAFNIITAGGEPGKVTTGRNFILYALIGMVVAFFARAIPSIVAALIR
jgi:hypothetical protein